MPKSTKTKKDHSSSRTTLIRISKIHLIIGLIFAVQIIIYDAGKLITPEAVLKRWIIAGGLVLAAAVCWYLARINDSKTVIKNLAWFLIIVDLLVASFSVYMQRGMASRAVLLFVLPLLVAGAMHRMGMIYLTAIMAVVAYVITAVAYFVINFNEGYKLELYGEISFYSAMILAISAMIWALVKSKH